MPREVSPDAAAPAFGRWTPRRLGALVVILAVMWTFVGLFALGAAVHGDQAFTLPLQRRVPAEVFLPQGWSFFARDPDSKVATAYRNEDGAWHRIGPRSRAERGNLFGLNRDPRLRDRELRLLLTELPSAAFTSCATSVFECLDAAEAQTAPHPLEGESPTLCGEIGIVLAQPLSWRVWRAHQSDMATPADVVKVAVQC